MLRNPTAALTSVAAVSVGAIFHSPHETTATPFRHSFSILYYTPGIIDKTIYLLRKYILFPHVMTVTVVLPPSVD